MDLFRNIREGNIKGIKETAASIEVKNDTLILQKKRSKRLIEYFSFRTRLFMLLTLLAIITVAGALTLYTWDNELITKGVVISNIDVSGLSKEQARERLEKVVKKWLTNPIRLEVEGEGIVLSLESLGAFTNIDSALNEAYEIGKKGFLLTRAKNKFDASHGVNFDLEPIWDDQKLKEGLNTSLSKFSKAPIDASFRLNDQNLMDIQIEKPGLSVDIETLLLQIKNIKISDNHVQFKVELKEEKPTVLASELESAKINGLVASYTTRFDATLVERSENVRLAAEALDGTLIKPGEMLSFNGIVGERTIGKGYKDAYIIVNGEFVPGLAGGICQVSSTLYNAGLLANLAISERSNHDLAISYAPLGQDATVAFPNLDLKMNNDTDGYLLIRANVSRNSLTISLYGKVKPGQEVILTDKTETVIPYKVETINDSSLRPGQMVVKQSGQPGYVVSSYRTVKKDGAIIKIENLGISKYEPMTRIVAVGPQVKPAPQPEPAPMPEPEPQPEA